MEFAHYDDAEYAMKKALKQVGLKEEFLYKKIYQCSGGEQQRIALAILLLKPCELVLCDEPTGSLDEKNRDLIFSLLQTLKEHGKSILIVTHDQQLLELCDHVIHL